MSKERVLITGGSGFIGTNLVEYFLKLGTYEILSLDVRLPKIDAHSIYFKNISILDVDVLKREIINFSPTLVFHLAARTDLNGTSLGDYAENIQGVKNVIAAIRSQSKIPVMTVFASSRLVCEIGYKPKSENDYCPSTIYGESKVIGEQIVREVAGLNFDWILVRPTSIWGPWFGVPYRNFFDAVKGGMYFHPSGAKVYKSFGYVGNSVFQLHTMAEAASQKLLRKTLYLCDYEPIEVGEWGNSIARQFKVRLPIPINLFLLKSLARIGDLFETVFRQAAPLTTFRLKNLVTDMIYETAAIEEEIPGLPYSQQAGIAETVAWINKGH